MLTKHHIVPSCYIKYLRYRIKKKLKEDHCYYYEWDYCCLCHKCHLKYETYFSNELHQLIWSTYDINIKETSYRQPHSGLPKPSEKVMEKIKSKEDYLELRGLCTKFFVDKMEPVYTLI